MIFVTQLTDVQRREQQQLANVVLDSTKDVIKERIYETTILIIVITSY
jgi:hypothetical protein